MKTSLFKKEITKKVGGEIVGGAQQSQYQGATIGMKATLRYVIPWGGVRDDHSASDTETRYDNW